MIQCLKIFMEVNLLSSRATSVISFLQLKTMLEELDGSNLLSSRGKAQQWRRRNIVKHFWQVASKAAASSQRGNCRRALQTEPLGRSNHLLKENLTASSLCKVQFYVGNNL
uniref:Uncharacterized protein n=1 Tax=Setaria viridis TaxID=4556 RepID=A0A4U6TPH7_SETVI|nr:hypothetical protein SEVIR_7G120950v2 [Setaria viridis]